MRKFIGGVMLATPFVIIFAGLIASEGLVAFLLVIASVAIFMGLIAGGVYLINE